MYGFRDLERIVGYSPDQLRDRVGRVWAIVATDHRRGPKNAVLVGDRTLAVLRRLRELEMGELGPQAAATQVLNEMGVDEGTPRGQAPTVAPSGPEHPQTLRNTSPNSDQADPWRLLLEEKDRSIRRLETENERLRNEVDRLLPLALPAPRRRRLWPFGRRSE